MTEIESLEKKLLALSLALSRLLDLLNTGRITQSRFDTYAREVRALQDDLGHRLRTLDETGAPIIQISDQDASRLRAAVTALNAQNLSEAAVRNLVDQALAIHDAIQGAGAASVGLERPSFSTKVDADFMRPQPPVDPARALLAAAAAVLALAAATLAKAAS